MNFERLMIRCKAGNRKALEIIFLMFKPLIVKKSMLNGKFEEDLFQLQCETLLKCIKGFRMDNE